MVVFLEGNIGAGKTTLLSKLENMGYVVVYEPVDEWMSMRARPDGESFFELFYKDKKRYGFMFQMVALQSRISHIQKLVAEKSETQLIICERSFFTDHQVFAKMLHDQKIISDEEFCVYKMWYNYLVELIKPKVSGIIYLKASPETCVKRIAKRNRKGEEELGLDYVRNVHDRHEDWLMSSTHVDLPIHIVDGEVDNLDVSDELVGFLSTLVTDESIA